MNMKVKPTPKSDKIEKEKSEDRSKTIMDTTNKELADELEKLAVRFYEGWHEGIDIDASDILNLYEASERLSKLKCQE